MQIVDDDQADVLEFTVEMPEPLLEWLESISCTPEYFVEVMRRPGSFHEKPEALGITLDEFCDGIECLTSLKMYAALLGITVEALWRKFEAHICVCPRWLIANLEDAITEKFSEMCG